MATTSDNNELKTILETALASLERSYLLERAAIANQLERLDAGYRTAPKRPRARKTAAKPRKRAISESGRKRIAAAQKERWRKVKLAAVEDRRAV